MTESIEFPTTLVCGICSAAVRIVCTPDEAERAAREHLELHHPDVPICKKASE